MSREYFYGRVTKASLKPGGNLSGPPVGRGVPDTGRIVRLFVGRGDGFIRLPNDREIYFHRADLHDGTSFNDFNIGDIVTFERIDDVVSGARALAVRRHSRER